MPKRSFRKFPAHIRSRDRIYLPKFFMEKTVGPQRVVGCQASHSLDAAAGAAGRQGSPSLTDGA